MLLQSVNDNYKLAIPNLFLTFHQTHGQTFNDVTVHLFGVNFEWAIHLNNFTHFYLPGAANY